MWQMWAGIRLPIVWVNVVVFHHFCHCFFPRLMKPVFQKKFKSDALQVAVHLYRVNSGLIVTFMQICLKASRYGFPYRESYGELFSVYRLTVQSLCCANNGNKQNGNRPRRIFLKYYFGYSVPIHFPPKFLHVILKFEIFRKNFCCSRNKLVWGQRVD